MILSGADKTFLMKMNLKKMCPYLDYENARFLSREHFCRKEGGTVRHDAVAWGYARGADLKGVDIIQNCEVEGFIIKNGKCVGVETNKE